MKKSLKAMGFAVLVVMFGCSTSAFAQRRGGGGRGGGNARRDVAVASAQGTLLLFTALLDLTDSQQAQVRSVFSAAQDAAGQLAQQTSRSQAIFEAVKAGASDDDIRGIASQAGTHATVLAVLQAQTFGKVWALLTDAQKTKVDVTMYDDIGQFLARPSSSAGIR